MVNKGRAVSSIFSRAVCIVWNKAELWARQAAKPSLHRSSKKLKSECISRQQLIHLSLIYVPQHPIQSQEAETFSSSEALFSFKLQK